MAGNDQVVTKSGGTMRRFSEPLAPGVSADLPALEAQRGHGYDGPVRPAGGAPYLDPGRVVTWHYRLGVDVLRVVRDDERGVVAWLPAGSQRLALVPRDGRGLRERSLAERAALAASTDYDHLPRTWAGPGILRIAPTGVPWSIWYFREDDGSFSGHYVNLELTHERPVADDPCLLTRDLTLDLWLGADGELWIKDEDELDSFTEAGRFTEKEAEVIRAAADRAREEVVLPRAWPLDEGWEDWSPLPEWDQPLELPAYLRS